MAALWGEINKVGMFSVPIGTTQDIGISGVCSVITQMCHRHCERMSSVCSKFKYLENYNPEAQGSRVKKKKSNNPDFSHI